MNFNIRQITSKLSPKGWLAVGGATIVGILFIYILMSLASKPSYTTVLAGVNPAQTGKITSALSTAGVSYQLQNGGTAVAVETQQQSKARVALASAGLLSGTGTSSVLSLGNSSLGESNFQQQVGYQSALEKQLDSAIENFSGVNSAQVQLVIPDASTELFSSTAEKSSAAVLLNMTTAPSASTTRAIAQMVADSVPSLATSKVTITDQNGDLLWPTSSGTSSAGSLLAAQTAEQTYDQEEAASLDAMLDSTLGVGKAQVQVNAQLNVNQTTQDSVTYANKGTPLTSTTSDETLTGASTTATGATGTSATQIAAYAATGSGNGSGSKYQNKSGSTQYGVSKTVAHTVVTPGTVAQQSVSVLVSKSVPASELASIQKAVANAAGYNAKRGDTLSVNQVKFATPTVATTKSSPLAMLGDAKYVAIGLGALLFLFFTSRALRRREETGFGGNPTWLRELEMPRSIADIEGEATLIEDPSVAALRSPINLAKRQVEDLVDRDPDRVASQLRQWMSED